MNGLLGSSLGLSGLVTVTQRDSLIVQSSSHISGESEQPAVEVDCIVVELGIGVSCCREPSGNNVLRQSGWFFWWYFWGVFVVCDFLLFL